jgi:MSHA biogenesis protein MshO
MRCLDKTMSAGFTLIEMVTVISITAIISAAVAIFLRLPMQGYVDTVRRGELADAADTAVRRMNRDMHLALSNSVRVDPGATAVEFLLVRSGGRYRSELTGTGSGDILDFNNAADAAFDVLGPAVPAVAGDQIVVYNLGIPGADAYAGDTRRSYLSTSAPQVFNFAATGTPFPFASPSSRFQVVEGPVSYVCAGGNLTRYSGYAITAAQNVPPIGGTAAVLAKDVDMTPGACSFTYDVLSSRVALVTIRLRITRDSESINLYHAVQISNAP